MQEWGLKICWAKEKLRETVIDINNKKLECRNDFTRFSNHLVKALCSSVLTGLSLLFILIKKCCTNYEMGKVYYFFDLQQRRNPNEKGLHEWDKVQSVVCRLICILCSLCIATAPMGIDNNNFFFNPCVSCRWICEILTLENCCQALELNINLSHLA